MVGSPGRKMNRGSCSPGYPYKPEGIIATDRGLYRRARGLFIGFSGFPPIPAARISRIRSARSVSSRDISPRRALQGTPIRSARDSPQGTVACPISSTTILRWNLFQRPLSWTTSWRAMRVWCAVPSSCRQQAPGRPPFRGGSAAGSAPPRALAQPAAAGGCREACGPYGGSMTVAAAAAAEVRGSQTKKGRSVCVRVYVCVCACLCVILL